MKRSRVAKFSMPVQIIGAIILIPSILGMLFSLLWVGIWIFSGVNLVMSSKTEQEAQVGAAVAGTFIVGSLLAVVASFVGGLLGWLLLMRRKVFKCQRCGFVLERA